jgi:hypothetical protein
MIPSNSVAYDAIHSINFSFVLKINNSKKVIHTPEIKPADFSVLMPNYNTEQGLESPLRAFEISMKQLNIDYIDLYLVHWPIRGKRKDTWLALERLLEEKRVKSIGVANYLIPFLEENPNPTDEQIREAWLRQVRANHPDRMIAQGLPEEAIAMATRKLALINDAYDRLRRERGLVPA